MTSLSLLADTTVAALLAKPAEILFNSYTMHLNDDKKVQYQRPKLDLCFFNLQLWTEEAK